MKGQNKDHDSSNRTNLALYSVTIPEVFRTRYSISEAVLGERRWRSGESPHQCGPGSLPVPPCHTWVEFVVGSRLVPAGSPVFLHPQNKASPNSNSTRIEGLHEGQLMWPFNFDFYIFTHQRSSGFTWTKIAQMLLVVRWTSYCGVLASR